MSLALGAWLGASGVALGAFAAHGLRERLDERGRQVFETGVRYQLVHAVALLALAGWERASFADGDMTRWCWALGTVVFSGSLYALALGAPRALGAVTPLGGLALVAGWLALIPQAGR